MKKIIPAILLLLSTHLFSQNYNPMLYNIEAWRVSTYGYFMGLYINSTYSTSIDTAIGGHTYKKILYNGANSVYTSYMREDSATRKVYSYIMGADQLTYDFSLNLGDSVYLHWVDGFYGSSSYNGYYTVDSVSVITTYAGPRKFMRLYSGHTYHTLLWLESVGSLNDYVDYPKDYCDLNDCGTESKTYCQTLNSVILYERTPLYSCDSGYLYDCKVTVNSVHVDSNYVFSCHVNGFGPYTYHWIVYDLDSNWLVVDSSNYYPSAHFVLPYNHYYSVRVLAHDSAWCNTSGEADFLDTIPPVSNPCDALFWVHPDTVDGNYFAVDLSSGSNLSYQWDFGDGGISTQQYPSHQYATAGHYTVCLTVNNGSGCISSYCDSTFYNYKVGGGPMSHLNVVAAPTGISETKDNPAIRIYPNPATDKLYIETNGMPITGINIYNTTGSLVMETKLSMTNYQLSIALLPPGIYIAEIKTPKSVAKGGDFNTVIMRRFVKM